MGDRDGEWYLSRDGESYDITPYGTRDEAVEAAVEMWHSLKSGETRCGEVFDGSDAENDASTFYVGRRIEWWPAVDEETVLCEAMDSADDYAGEYADGWLEAVPAHERAKLRDLLQEAFDRWMRETGNEPHFFMVERVGKYDTDGRMIERTGG